MNQKIISIIMAIIMLASAAGICGTVYHAKQNSKLSDNSFSQQVPEDIQNDKSPEQPPENNGFQSNQNAPSEPFNDQGDFQPINDEAKPNEFSQNEFKRDASMKSTQLNAVYISIIAVLSLLFSLSLIYLVMTAKNKAVFMNKDKIIIFILAAALLTTYLTGGVTISANRFVLNDNQMNAQQSTEKDKVSLNSDNVVSSSSVDLSTYEDDVTITKGGTYEISGSFEKSIVVNAPNEDVELILDNVQISNAQTAAIIGLSAKTVTINIKDNTENILSDGGNSEYDACVFSNTPLVFTGNGTLTVNGKQNEGEGIATETADITVESGKLIITSADDGINAGGDGAQITINGGEIFIDASGDGIDSNKNAVINGGELFVLGSDVGGDAGIDTDEGYVINGGTVVALGSDMIEAPMAGSAQNTLAITLDSQIEKNTCVSLMHGDDALISFNSPKSFKTIIISSASLENSEYTLYTGSADDSSYGIYKDGTFVNQNAVTVNSQQVFTVSQSVNQYGRNR